MKFLTAIAASVLLLSGTTASAALYNVVGGPYDETYVGMLDDFLGETDDLANSNPETEAAWLASVTGADLNEVEFIIKDPGVTYYETGAANIFAFLMEGTPSEYFIIKQGQWWSLFANNVELSWGVFDASLLSGNFGDFQVSHVSRFNAADVPVPEPTTLALLGLGLVGFGVARRRMATR